ncbi:hypothetical protein [Achromobacter agilis]|uniref:Uncharacterized protein n=1 Tax=Achromobacter agilis TaxID=1353888 RepID=A0A446C514_9BURK|nr:hypothetical protein [Achromobacter agilis]SSW62871.1 hypothetical protein AGI3411_00720 [Achromobacter agilis]
MSITYRPPFDEDDERDLRALYRRPGPGSSPELDAAVRRRWHPGHSWHPGWGAAACAAMVAGLFAWTDMREAQQDVAGPATQLIAPRESGAGQDRSDPTSPVQAEAPSAQAVPVMQRETAPQGDAPPSQAVPAQEAPANGAQQAAEAPQGEAVAAEAAPFGEQDIEARVAHIRSLMQAEQQDDAVNALRELQQGAPDLALPDDLQELADQNPA